MPPLVPRGVAEYLDRRGLGRAAVEPLTGDASDRRYFRVEPPTGAPFVIALHAEPFEAGSLPFLTVATMLAPAGVPTPRVLDEAGDLGILALEDLGDVTLQAHLESATGDRRDWLYTCAVDYIERIQMRVEPPAAAAPGPFGLAFDVEKLLWEMRFFMTHFLEAFRGVTLEPASRAALETALTEVVTELAAEPRVLCHRDYHSRNLMVLGDRLVVIDFQDARMGPDTYDLASLLRDSYVDLPATLVDGLIAGFGRAVGHGADLVRFRQRFDLMAVQRSLKALGTFGYQATSRANPAYARYVPRTLDHVRANLQRHRRFGRLHDVLSTMLPELR